MMLTLTASIMYWSMQRKPGQNEPPPPSQHNDEPEASTDGDNEVVKEDDNV